MRLVLFFSLFILPVLASADTIDFYHVYFHGKKIGEYSQNQIIRVVMKADSISTFDTLKVKVHRDAGCSNCTYSLLIFGSKGPLLIDTTQQGQDFYIALAPLVASYRQTKQNSYHGYYTEYFEDPTKSRVVSFEIRLQ